MRVGRSPPRHRYSILITDRDTQDTAEHTIQPEINARMNPPVKQPHFVVQLCYFISIAFDVWRASRFYRVMKRIESGGIIGRQCDVSPACTDTEYSELTVYWKCHFSLLWRLARLTVFPCVISPCTGGIRLWCYWFSVGLFRIDPAFLFHGDCYLMYFVRMPPADMVNDNGRDAIIVADWIFLHELNRRRPSN